MFKLFKVSIVTIGLFFLFTLSVNAQNDTLILIANEKGAPNQMSKSFTRKVLKGQRPRWKNGSKVKLCLMKTSTPSGIKTAKDYYNMNVRQLNRYWLALVFQGKSTAPLFFRSEEKLIAYVMKTYGAIGIISKKNKGRAKEVTIATKK